MDDENSSGNAAIIDVGKNGSDAAAIIDAVRKLASPSTVDLPPNPEGARVLVLPPGLRLHSLKKYEDERRTHPERRVGTAELTTLGSFVDHVVRFSDQHSAVFADDNREHPELVAILDYHEDSAAGSPRFGTHRSRYRFPLSEEWQRWSRLSGKLVDQATLAAHLEDHLDDILDPAAVSDSIKEFAETHGIALASAARLQELARGLSIRIDRRVESVHNPSTGEARMLFEESHSDESGGELKIPTGFALAIPVFRGGGLYQIPVRLRYRVSKGQVRWSIALHRTDRVFDHAFAGACESVQEGTGRPLFFGRPETT